jgi:hypothetical protein
MILDELVSVRLVIMTAVWLVHNTIAEALCYMDAEISALEGKLSKAREVKA